MMKIIFIVLLVFLSSCFRSANRSEINQQLKDIKQYRTELSDLSNDIGQTKISLRKGDKTLTQDWMRNEQDVIEYYDSLLTTNPDSFQILYDFASVYDIIGHYEKSKKLYEKIFKLYPDKYDNLALDYAGCFEELDQLKESIKIIRKSLNNCVNCSKYHLRLGNIYIGQHDYANAYKEYNQIDSSLYADNIMYLSNFALILSKREVELKKGIRLINKVIESESDYLFYYEKILGDLLYLTKRYSEALQVYTKVIRQTEWDEVESRINIIKDILQKK